MSLDEEFLSPPLTPYSLDFQPTRAAIATALRAALPHFSGTVVDIGCGQQPYRSLLLNSPSGASKYLGVDLRNEYNRQRQPDLFWDGQHIPLDDGSADSGLLTEVLEHCPDPVAVLAEVRRVLRPGAFLFVTVPCLWPIHDAPWDFHRFTPYSLERAFRLAGFSQWDIQATGGWDRSLALVLGLWVARRPMPEFRRRLLRRLLFPICRRLLASPETVSDFAAGPLMPGLIANVRA
jgi:SAM-dependent methyltransferase